MPLAHTILAVLADGPLHGHAVGQRVRALLCDLRPVNVGQVHATLARLARDGLVTRGAPDAPAVADVATSPPPKRSARAPDRGSRGRPIVPPPAATSVAGVARGARRPLQAYALQPAGRQHLRRWLERPVELGPSRDMLAIRIALLRPDDDLAPLVAAHRNWCATARRAITAAARRDAGNAGERDVASVAEQRARLRRHLVDAALRHLDVELEWMRDIERLRRDATPS